MGVEKNLQTGEYIMLFFGYPKCSTSRKAEQWLIANKVPYDFRDIKLENPTRADLEVIWDRSCLPLDKLFNTHGQLYRQMELSKKLKTMTDDEKLDLLATDGMLVKRPIYLDPKFALVGFKEADWAEKLL